VSIAGKCPTEWDTCSLVLRTSVDFIHNESLRSGELVYSLYRFAEAITKVVDRKIPGVKVLYVGQRDVAANFGITLNGAPQGETMNTVQQQYFADVTVDFLSASSSGRVLDLQIDKQIDNDGSIQVVGRLLGASYRPAAAFANELEAAFREGQDVYVQKLVQGRLRPNAINEIGGIEFFEGISSVGVRVDAAAPQEEGSGNISFLIVVIGSVLGGIVLILLACWCRRTRVISRKERQEDEGYREEMKQERRARRREESKERLIWHDEDPEQVLGSRETITPTPDVGSDDELAHSSDENGRHSSAVADFSDFPEDSKSLHHARSTDNSERGPSNSDKVPSLGETSGATPAALSTFMKAQPEPSVGKVSESRSVQYQPPTDSSNKSRRKAKEAEDVPPRSPRKRAPVRGNTKSLDEDVFRGKIGQHSQVRSRRKNDEDSDTQEKASKAPAPAKSTSASPVALSRFMKAQPEPSVSKVSESRSVQYQPPADSSNKSRRKAKEAEDVPPRSPRKRAPVRGNTKSLDEDVFRGKIGQNSQVRSRRKNDEDNDTPGTASKAPVPARMTSASPAALSRFMKAQPEPSVSKVSESRSVQYQPPADSSNKSRRKVKEAEDVPPESPRKRAPVRGTTKSLDEEFFRGKIGQNSLVRSRRKNDEDSDKPGTASKAPTPAKPTSASPAALSRFVKEQPKSPTNEMSGLRSVQYQPLAVLGTTSTKVKEAEFVKEQPKSPSNEISGLRSVQYQPPAVLGTTSTKVKEAEFVKEQPKSPSNEMSGLRSVQYQPPAVLGTTSNKTKEAEEVPPGSPRKRAPVRVTTKSRNEDAFRGELGQNSRVSSRPKIGEDSDKPGTASKAPTSAKPIGASPAALSRFTKEQPKSLTKNMIRVPSRSKNDEDSDKPGTAFKAPASAKPNGAPPAAPPSPAPKFVKEEPKSPTNEMSGSRTFQYQPPTVLAPLSRR
jgi:hypothetical protein